MPESLKTIVASSSGAGFARALAALLDAGLYRVVPEAGHEGFAAAPFAVVAECDLDGGEALETVSALRAKFPSSPLVVLAGLVERGIEERAYLAGVAHVLPAPPRAAILHEILGRLAAGGGRKPREAGAEQAAAPSHTPHAQRDRPGFPGGELAALLAGAGAESEIFSGFLMLLHRGMGVRRAAFFLRDKSPGEGGFRDFRGRMAVGPGRSQLLGRILPEHDGVGADILRSAGILDAGGGAATLSPATASEMRALGVAAALPLVADDDIIGIVALDGLLDGTPLPPGDLHVLYHALEAVGEAVATLRRAERDRQAISLLEKALDALPCGRLVFHPPETIVEIDGRARGMLGLDSSKPVSLHDLPSEFASKVFDMARGGEERGTFGFAGGVNAAPMRAVCVRAGVAGFPAGARLVLLLEAGLAFRDGASASAAAADRLMIERMAEHLSHEIGNALAPLSVHQQLLDTRHDDPEFRQSLAATLDSSVRRVSRLGRQLLHVSRTDYQRRKSVPLTPLLYEAWRDARAYVPGAPAEFDYSGRADIEVEADPQALRHAFAELLCNGLQAGGGAPRVAVVLSATPPGETPDSAPPGALNVRIDLIDAGGGFAENLAEMAVQPFFSTRTVGAGLGLASAKSILDAHGARLVLHESPPTQSSPSVSVILPGRAAMRKDGAAAAPTAREPAAPATT